MNTRLHGELLPTSITNWQFDLAPRLPVKLLELDAEVGLGTRTFTIDSKDPARSPDGNYDYLVVGTRARRHFGQSITGIAFLAFEPVLSGRQATDTAFGTATRWALEARATLRWVLGSHVLIEGTAGWQRFTWAWPSAGGRGGGSASDDYFSAGAALGAQL
jgi:hypothetical protein